MTGVRLFLSSLLAVSSLATAQLPEQNPSTVEGADVRWLDEWFEIRARAAVAVRNGSQSESDTSAALSYSGVTPNDLALRGWWWFALENRLGASLEIQREAFGLFSQDGRVTGGGLIRAHAAATARFRLGPVRLEPLLGYALHQIPKFGSEATPSFSGVTRHALLLGAAIRVDVGPVTLEGRGEYPLSLATNDGSSIQGFSAGAAVRVQLFRIGSAHFGLLGEFGYQSDALKTVNALQSNQSVIRGGLGIDVAFRESVAVAATIVREPIKTQLILRITDEAQKPLRGVTVKCTGVATAMATSDELGTAVLGELAEGTLLTSFNLQGYEPLTRKIDMVSGKNETTVSLVLEKPKVGSVAVTVVDQQTKKPLATATVKLGSETATTDKLGLARFEQLPVGNVAIAVTMPGYKSAQEAASVIAQKESAVQVTLTPTQVRLPAAIKGQVRTLVGGTPLAADLEIPELKLKTRADANGAFSVTVSGGTYTVRISARGFVTQTKSVVVRDGDSTIFNVDLSSK